MSIIKVKDRFFQPFIHANEIAERTHQIAGIIENAYQDKNPLFLCVLNGAFIFAADLLRSIHIQSEISFVKVASYKGMDSSGEIKELIGFNEQVNGRHVIIIEDIIDTGYTMQHILKQLQAMHPASIRVTTLLFKKSALQYPVQIDDVGFEIENKFVLGYGLDYDGLGRHLKHIYQVSEQG